VSTFPDTGLSGPGIPSPARRLIERLRGSTAMVGLLAVAAAVPLGVLLPQSAAGQIVTLSGANTVNHTYAVTEAIGADSTQPIIYAPSGTPWTIVNQGNIANFGGTPSSRTDYWAIKAAGAGVFVTNANRGVITGYGAVYLGGAGTVSNAGTITGSGGVYSFGIKLANGGTITNTGLVDISGGLNAAAIYLTNGGTVTNSGTIAGNNADYGIKLTQGGVVTNTAGATVQGYLFGIKMNNAGGTVTNYGTISGTQGVGVDLIAGGTVNNLGIASSISSAGDGVILGVSEGAGSVVNQGTIRGGSGFGVYIGPGGGNITNSGTASRISGAYGILFVGNGTLVNQGTITSTDSRRAGAYFKAGGTVTNSGAAARIVGADNGVNFSATYGGLGTVTNSGVIQGTTGAGVLMNGSGTITNQAGGLIDGATAGVKVTGGTVQITNSGTIMGSGASGVGVLFAGSAQGTIDNFGTISGAGGTAVQFAGGTNELIIENGGVLEGTANGTNGNNTLLLIGSGRLSQAQAVGFQTVSFSGDASTIDSATTVENAAIGSGSTVTNQGTLTGSLTIASGGTLSNAGTISPGASAVSNTGSLANSGTITGSSSVTNSGTLSNSGTIVFSVTAVTNTGIVNNSGTIIGSSGVGVYLGGGTLTNVAGGYIKGGRYGVQIAAGGTVINAGIILDNTTAGASLGSNAVLTNQNGGTISGAVGVLFTGTGASVTNAGTITGTSGVAVQFDAGSNSLTLTTGSVLNGSIDGGGGAGQITLAGSGSLANAVTNFGAGSALTIAAGANWSATGSWTIATVTNAGQFMAGSLTAPLSLTGNFAQSSTGTLNVALGAAGASSQLRVTGSAALAGGVAASSSGAFLHPGTDYTILTASNGITGTFNSVTLTSALLTPSLSYGADDVILSLSQETSIASVAGTPNEQAVGAALDAASAANSSGFAATVLGLDQLSTPGLRATLDRLSGENNAGLTTTALMAGDQFLGVVQRQLSFAHLGAAGSADDQAAMNMGTRVQLASLSGGPGDPSLSKPWGIWASGYGQSGEIDGDGNSHNLAETIAGGAFGTDYRINSRLLVGAAVGLGNAEFNVADGLGQGNVNHTQLALYGDYTEGRAYLDGTLGGAYGEGTTRRDTSVPGAPSTAYADISDQQFLGSLEAGYALPLRKATLTPFAGMNFGVVNQNGFTEHGAGVLDLSVHGQSEGSAQSALGARLSDVVPVGGINLALDAGLGWTHEFASTERSAIESFTGGPGGSFTVVGASVPRDAALVSFGVATSVATNTSLYLTYQGQFGDGYSNAATGGLRFTW
jgi:uncharacterized protein with beta-barrel porin domain